MCTFNMTFATMVVMQLLLHIYLLSKLRNTNTLREKYGRQGFDFKSKLHKQIDMKRNTRQFKSVRLEMI